MTARTVVPGAPSVALGDVLQVSVTRQRIVVPGAPSVALGDVTPSERDPLEDRWIADPPGALPSTVQLTSREADLGRKCVREHAQILPELPGDLLEVMLPPTTSRGVHLPRGLVLPAGCGPRHRSAS